MKKSIILSLVMLSLFFTAFSIFAEATKSEYQNILLKYVAQLTSTNTKSSEKVEIIKKIISIVQQIQNSPKVVNNTFIQEFKKLSEQVRYGQRGKNVRNLQKFLADRNFYPKNKIDGAYGPMTRRAVEKARAEYFSTTIIKVDKNSDFIKIFNEKELQNYLAKIPKNNNFYLPTFGGEIDRMIGVPITTMTKSVSNEADFSVAESGSASSDDFSQTNIQVEGVDEGDIVKTDGKYIYAVSGNKIMISQAYPAKDAKKITEIDVKKYIREIYLDGNKLIVLYNDWKKEKILSKKMMIGGDYYGGNQSFVAIKVYNISNPEKPDLKNSYAVEGNLNSSRYTNHYLYLVTSKYLYNNRPPMMPYLKRDGMTITEDLKISPLYCIPYPDTSNSIVSVTAISPENSKINSERFLIPRAANIFVSTENIYLTYTKYLDRQKLSWKIYNEVIKKVMEQQIPTKDKKLIADIEKTDTKILTEIEKLRKINNIYASYANNLDADKQEEIQKEISAKTAEKYQELFGEFEQTLIHKIAFDKLKISPQAKGIVSGHVLNQFAMDEYQENFRIATTNSRTWLPWQVRNMIDEKEMESQNNLYILDKNLKKMGAVEGLAKGERIYSVRFMGKTGYIVTFKQVDPLFVIDLENPKNPKVLGQLKVPGFSNYLHPYNKNVMIGIGRDTIEKNGRVRTAGLKVSLFNVKDQLHPAEVDSIIIGDSGSYSEALNNHKAVLFSKEKNLLAFPATVREKESDNYYKDRKTGILVFDIDEKSIKLHGQISDQEFNSCSGLRTASAQRALYIGDNLYSISQDGIKINALNTLKNINQINFLGENTICPVSKKPINFPEEVEIQ